MTFTLAARCPATGQFGIVIASSSPAVAARCVHARAGVGVAASQNVTDPALGPKILDLMELGVSAPGALARLAGSERNIGWRQLLAVDVNGDVASHTGALALGINGSAAGTAVVAGGNMLADMHVPQAMIAGYGGAAGRPFGDRLMAGLQAGLAAGGEAGPVHSAGMKIVDRLSWPLVDLRVDWAETDPIGQLARLWEIYAPQADAYVRRAENPGDAPGYGVPGDQR